jgi:hypothetical protein
MARSSTGTTRADLVEYIAWRVRDASNVRKATLDLLSELERSPKWGNAAARVPDGPPLTRLARAVARRVEEIR